MSYKEIDKDIWENISERLKREIGQSAFENWLKPLKFIEISDKRAIFRSPTGFIGDWVNRNYGEKIVSAFQSDGFQIDRLEFMSITHPRG